MKLNFTSIKSKLITFWHRARRRSAHDPITPVRDWQFLLIGGAILLLVTVGFGAYLFFQVKSGEAGEAPPGDQNTSVVFEKEELVEALSQLQKNEQEYEELKRVPPQTNDPAR